MYHTQNIKTFNKKIVNHFFMFRLSIISNYDKNNIQKELIHNSLPREWSGLTYKKNLSITIYLREWSGRNGRDYSSYDFGVVDDTKKFVTRNMVSWSTDYGGRSPHGVYLSNSKILLVKSIKMRRSVTQRRNYNIYKPLNSVTHFSLDIFVEVRN